MDFLQWGVTALFGIIGWLLANKDKKQGEEIAELKNEFKKEVETLYRLHHLDEEKLAEYKLIVAQNHYTQPQVDFRFQQLDNTMREGFKELSADIKDMTKLLQAHLMESK